jgi:hypothetical protein
MTRSITPVHRPSAKAQWGWHVEHRAQCPLVMFVMMVALTLTIVLPAAAADYFKTADGIAVYLGIMPAELVAGHTTGDPVDRKRSPQRATVREHHIIVAVFDSATGERMTAAEVWIRVQGFGVSPWKKLEPMLIDDQVAYGNYFDIVRAGPSRIEIHVRDDRRGRRPVMVSFDYFHPRQ